LAAFVDDVARQRELDVPLVGFVAQPQKVEVIRILEDLRRHPCMLCGQTLRKVGDCGPLAQMELASNLLSERLTPPRLRDRLTARALHHAARCPVVQNRGVSPLPVACRSRPHTIG